MSLLSLPDEILNNIVILAVAAYQLDAEFKGELRHELFPEGPVFCADRGALQLSTINHRLRRICIPILFSNVVLRVQHSGSYFSYIDLDYLKQVLEKRPWIKEHVRSLSLSHDQDDPNPQISDPSPLVPILKLLPRLVNLPRTDHITEDFVYAINEHPNIISVTARTMFLAVENWLPSDTPLDEVFPPGFFRKMTQRYLDSRVLYCDAQRIDESRIVQDLKLGMNINELVIQCTPNIVSILQSFPFNNIHRFMISILPDDAEKIGEAFPDWLSSFVVRVRSIASILIAPPDCSSEFMLLSSVRDAVQESGILDIGSLIDFEMEATAPKSQQPRASNDWDQDWRVSHLSLRTESFPMPSSVLSTFGEKLSGLTSFTIHLTRERGQPVLVTDSDAISDQLSALRSLRRRRLRLGNLRFPDGRGEDVDSQLDEEQKAMVHELASAIHSRLELLDYIKLLIWTPSDDIYVADYMIEVRIRRRLVTEAEGVEIAVEGKVTKWG